MKNITLLNDSALNDIQGGLFTAGGGPITLTIASSKETQGSLGLATKPSSIKVVYNDGISEAILVNKNIS